MTPGRMGDTGTAIRLAGLAKTFAGGTRALAPTDLAVEPGEILVLLGPSGCGKTTLLRLIAGLETPDPGGSVRFGEDDVTRTPVERRAVGLVFQSYALFPNLSVRGNIGYGLRVRGLPRAEIAAGVDRVMALCRLDGLGERPVSALSGGQRQRVALARAVAPGPRVLLLDEPLSALDAALRDRLRGELAALLRRLSTTAIFVTHDQAEAMAIADRIAVMAGGSILQIDTPERLYRAPASGFVATFFGGANRLGAEAAGARLVLPGGGLALPRPLAPEEAAFVRPEAVRLAPAEGAALKGTVATAVFRGADHRLLIEGATAEPLAADHAGGPVPAPGTRVGLAVAPEDILILPDTTEASA